MINQIYQSLDNRRKRGFIFLILCNVILFFFEFLSLASIPIFVTTVIDTQFALEKLKIIQNFIPLINVEIIEQNIEIYAGIFIVSLFFLKNIFLSFLLFGKQCTLNIIKFLCLSKYTNNFYLCLTIFM